MDDLGWTFRIVTVISLTAGTMFLMWLGDQITERGIGNGMSLIITVGIVARLPAALVQAWKTFVPSAQTGASQVNPMVLVLMVAFLVFVIAAVIAITQGVRKITVQYAKRVVGRKMYGGQTQYMPLKVNYAGVMPIIFAWALLFFPATIVELWLSRTVRTANRIAARAFDRVAALRRSRGDDFLLQLFLGRDAVSAGPDRGRSEEIRRLHPRRATGKTDCRLSRFHDDAPDFCRRDLSDADRGVAQVLLSQWLNVPVITAQFFGGTSLLIIVGVMLDTMRQVETHLIQRHYDGFLRKGRIRGRSFDRAAYSARRSGGAAAR